MRPFTKSRDERIITDVLAGRHEQFGLLVERYLPVVHAIAHARLNNPADVDDAAQETFLKAFQNLDHLRERPKFPAWLAAIARNTAAAFQKQRTRETPLEEAPIHEPNTGAPDFAARELRETVRNQIAQLEPEAREVLLLYYFAGKSCHDIAAIVEATEPAVRKRLQRAREALGAQLLAQFKDDQLLPQERRAAQAKRILTAALATSPVWTTNAAAATTATTFTAATLAKVLAVPAIVALAATAVVLNSQSSQPPEPTPSTQDTAATPDPQPSIPADAHPPATDSPAANSSTQPPSVLASTAAPTGIPVSGTVLHTNGEPVPDAVVKGAYWGHRPRREPIETTADEHGQFTLYLDKPWDVFLVYAEKHGYVRFRQSEIEVTQDGFTGVEVSLFHEATIQGRVTDQHGNPVAEKPITAFNNDADNILWTREAHTAQDGSFTLPGLIPGEYSLAIVDRRDFDPGMENLRVDVPEGSHLTGVDIAYAGDGLVIAGRVIDEDGAPIRNAFVQAVGAQGFKPRDSYTRQDGTFRIIQMREGEFPVFVTHDHYQSESFAATAGTEDLEIVLRRRATVSGQVIDATTKQPIQNFEVYSVPGLATTIHASHEPWFEAHFDDEGRFTIQNVGLDQATIIARAEGYSPAFEFVQLESAQHLQDLTIQLNAGLAIAGTVRASTGQLVENAYITLGPPLYVPPGVQPAFFARQTAENARATTDTQGAFTITSLSPGLQQFSAWHPEFGSGTIITGVPTPPATPIEITLRRGGKITGLVLLGGVPQPDITVTATPIEGPTRMSFSNTTTAANGRYELTNVHPGEVNVAAILPTDPIPGGHPLIKGRRINQTITVHDEEETILNLEFSTELGAIHGTLELPPDLQPRGNVICKVTTGDAEELQYILIEDTTFTVHGLPAGNAQLTVYISNELPPGAEAQQTRIRTLNTTVQPGHTTQIQLQFTGDSTITGQIQGIQPPERAIVYAFEGAIQIPQWDNPTQESLMHLARAHASITPNGTYTLPGLHPGTYTLLATPIQSDPALDTPYATTTITITPQTTLTQNFNLR